MCGIAYVTGGVGCWRKPVAKKTVARTDVSGSNAIEDVLQTLWMVLVKHTTPRYQIFRVSDVRSLVTLYTPEWIALVFWTVQQQPFA